MREWLMGIKRRIFGCGQPYPDRVNPYPKTLAEVGKPCPWRPSDDLWSLIGNRAHCSRELWEECKKDTDHLLGEWLAMYRLDWDMLEQSYDYFMWASDVIAKAQASDRRPSLARIGYEIEHERYKRGDTETMGPPGWRERRANRLSGPGPRPSGSTISDEDWQDFVDRTNRPD